MTLTGECTNIVNIKVGINFEIFTGISKPIP